MFLNTTVYTWAMNLHATALPLTHLTALRLPDVELLTEPKVRHDKRPDFVDHPVKGHRKQ